MTLSLPLYSEGGQIHDAGITTQGNAGSRSVDVEDIDDG
jgi:hypothetical protein